MVHFGAYVDYKVGISLGRKRCDNKIPQLNVSHSMEVAVMPPSATLATTVMRTAMLQTHRYTQRTQ